MKSGITTRLGFQWAREQAENGVFIAFFFRFRAGGFA
jgi:hypothetical protein